MRIENRMQLQLWREECKEKRQKENCCILVCGGTGCLAGGSDKIYARLKELTSNMDHVTVKIKRLQGASHPVQGGSYLIPERSYLEIFWVNSRFLMRLSRL